MLVMLLLASGLTFMTVVLHGAGTVSLVHPLFRYSADARNRSRIFLAVLIAQVVVRLLLVHLVEVMVWAAVLFWGKMLPDFTSAAYFSMTSYTTVGYGDLVLERLEAGVSTTA